MKSARLRGAACLVLAFFPGWASVSSAEEALQPYQLVRSLQLVQDRIAAGDHAALPMQAKLLEMVDARLRTASPDDFKEPRNFRALLVYGMSGGNPVTVEAATARAEPDEQDRAVAGGVMDYLNGRPAAAITAFTPVDPMTLPSDLGAFVALVKGSLLATDQPVQALALLDQARLLSPGTLVEEAALRRSVGIAAALGDAARFTLASTQYVERYLHSPYASQFADSFVSGVIALHFAIGQERLADITAMMDPEREKVIYLRIARRAAIDGMADLSAFASARAEQGRDGKSNDGDPRALLYASLSTVTSETVKEVRARLETIDRSQLSEGDQALLDAAQAVARELTAPPAPVSLPKPAPAKAAREPVRDKPAMAADTSAAPSDGGDLPPVEGIASERPASRAQIGKGPERQGQDQTAAEAAGSPPDTAAGPSANAAPGAPAPPPAEPPVELAAAPAAAPADPADAAIIDARRKIDLIDQMLGASPR